MYLAASDPARSPTDDASSTAAADVTAATTW